MNDEDRETKNVNQFKKVSPEFKKFHLDKKDVF